MSAVFIDIGGVLEVAQSFDSCIEGIRDQQDEMRRLLNTTDPRVLDRHNIRERINNSIKELCWEEDKLRQIQSVLRLAANSYAQAERTIKQQDREFSSRIDSLVKNVTSESGGLLNSIGNAFSNAGRFIEDEAQAAEKEFETGAKVLQGEAEAAWNGITDWVGKHKKAIIIAAAAIALIAIGIATCGVGDAAIFAVLGAGAIGAGSGLAGEEISDYMDDGKIDNSDQSYVGSAVGGFITGAICPLGGTEAVGLKGIGLQFAKNGLAGIAGNAAGQQITTGKIDFKEAFVSGAISGVLTVAAGKIPKIGVTENEGGGNAGLYRKVSNIGDFSDLKVPMQMRSVKSVANQAGIGLNGIKVSIVRNPELIGKGLYGYTSPNGSIQLYPDAFTDTESLVKTLGHERMHVYQYQTFGPALDSSALNAYESAAYQSESSWWNYYGR